MWPERTFACYLLASTGDADIDEFNASAINLSENLQRRDLRPFEIAEKLYAMRKARPSTSVRELSERTGLSYPYVSALLRIRTKAVPQLWDLFCTYGTQFGNGITYKDMIKITGKPKGEQLAAWGKLVAERTGKSASKKKKKKGPKPLRPDEIEAFLGVTDELGGPPDWRKGIRFGLNVALGRQTWSKKKAPRPSKAKAKKKATAKKRATRKTNSKSNSRARARA